MTAHVNYLRNRDGVFQYERRVPLRVQRNVLRYQALFGSRPLFRRSLRTKDAVGMMAAYVEANAEFEARIAKALERPSLPTQTIQSSRTPITQDLLDDIIVRYRDIYAGPFEKLHRLAESNVGAAEELAHMQYQFENNAESIMHSLLSKNPPKENLIITPAEEARSVISERNLDAVDGSQEFGALVGAIRAGMMQGYERIGALNSGEISPSPPQSISKKAYPARITIRDAVERFIRDREMPIKTKQEVSLSLRARFRSSSNLTVPCGSAREHAD